MFFKFSKILVMSLVVSVYAQDFQSPKGFEKESPMSILKRLGNKVNTTAERSQYAKELYWSVNGYPATVDTSNRADPYLTTFNRILGENGLGGILYGAGYETCDAIPTSGSASGEVQRVGTLNLTFGAGTKTVPSYYQADGGETMDKRIVVAGNVTMEVELKCNTNTAIQTGYVKLTYTQFNYVYEGYFQQNSTTGAVNLDIYVKTETGGGTELLIPTQFVTTNGENFTIYSGYIYPSGGGGGQDHVVAVNGVVNGAAQLAFLQTTDTMGAPVTTAPQNFGSLTSSGGTVAAVECLDIANDTTTTGCSAIPAPGTLSIGGSSNTWTVTTLKAVSL